MADQNGAQNPGFMAPLTRAQSPIALPYHDPNDTGTGTGTGTGQPGAGGGAPAGGATPPGGGQQPVTPPAEKTFSFKEDRSDWTPRHRLNEESSKRTAAERERDELKAKLEVESKRTRALAGLETPDAKTAETEEIRSALYTMFPQLKALENLTAEQLEQVFEAANAARSTSAAAWERHSLQMLGDLDGEASKLLGVETLTPTQQKNLRRAYREEATFAIQERQKAVQAGQRPTVETMPGDTDFVARHERGDKTLIKEFVKAFMDDWFEPARRSVTANNARRQMRPVPRGGREQLPLTQGEQKVNLDNKDEFKKALLAARGQSE